MKEATGELNMTVITVVAITAVAALFYAFVWPSIKTNIAANSACNGGPNSAGTINDSGDKYTCGAANAKTGQYTCTVTINGKNTTKTCESK